MCTSGLRIGQKRVVVVHCRAGRLCKRKARRERAQPLTRRARAAGGAAARRGAGAGGAAGRRGRRRAAGRAGRRAGRGAQPARAGRGAGLCRRAAARARARGRPAQRRGAQVCRLSAHVTHCPPPVSTAGAAAPFACAPAVMARSGRRMRAPLGARACPELHARPTCNLPVARRMCARTCSRAGAGHHAPRKVMDMLVLAWRVTQQQNFSPLPPFLA